MKTNDVIYKLASYTTINESKFLNLFGGEHEWVVSQSGQEVGIHKFNTGFYWIPAWVLANYVDVADALCMVLDELGKTYRITSENIASGPMTNRQSFRITLGKFELISSKDFKKVENKFL